MKIVSANITGSFILNGVDLTTTVESSSIWSGSIAQRVSNLEQFSSSLDSTYATDAQLNSVTQSVNTLSSSFLSYTSSTDDKIAQLNRETASLNLATSSIYNFSASIFSYTASNNDSIADIRVATASLYAATASINSYTASNNNNVAALYAATASLYNATASIYGATSSLFSYSASATLRINALDQYTASLNTRSASFACVDSTNNFACTQYFSNTSNAVSFTSTGSLYSDGGMRITKDMYVSGTAFFNNVTVFGTQSINYISSSQLNIASNIISVNTATPTVRFGGLAVYDSGSLGTGLTGSILWDSEDNQWIYSNPSGSTYDSAVFLVGPRNTGVLGNEPGISCNFLSKGNGLHHMTSSGIFEDGSRTCFYGNTVVSSSGTVCTTMANASCVGINTTTPFKRLTINTSGVASDGIAVSGDSSPAYIICETSGVGSTFTNDSAAGYIGTITNHPFNVRSNSQNRLTFSSAGVACFACQVCTPSLTTTSVLCSTGGTNYFGNAILAYAPACDSILGGSVLISGGYSVIRGGTDRSFNIDNYINSSTCVNALKIFNSGIACFGCTTCAPTLVAGAGGIRSSNNIIFPANLTTFTIWNEGYGGAVQLRRSDASTDRYARIGIVDGSGNWVAGMTINGSNSNAEFGAGVCAASYVCATGGAVFASTNIRVSTGTAAGNSSDPAITTGGCTKTGIYFDGSCVAFGSGGNSLLLAQNGNVGIGTSSPTCKLEVDGGSSAVALRISTTSPSTGTAALILANSSKSAFNDGMIMTHGGGYTNITGLTGATIMAWDMSNCRVGIGTVSPSYKLDVNGTGRYIGSLTINEDGGGTKVLTVRSDWAGVDPAINVTTNNCLLLMTNNTVRVCLSNTGIATFACQVCTPTLYVGNASNNAIISYARIHLNTCIQRFYTINHWELANGSGNQCIVVDGAATYGCAKVANINATETFFYGPYAYLTPGSYVAKFRMKVDNNSSRANLLYLDTNRGSGSNISANTFCTSRCYQYIVLPFTISSPSDVFEARALNYTSGITCTYLDHVLIEAQENPGQYFSKDNFRLYTGHFNCSRLSIDTSGNTIFNCNGTYCSNFGYNFLTACNGSILSGTHTMGNMGAGITCATPYWCDGGALRMEFNWSTGGYIQWINHNNCVPYLLQWSTNYTTKHCFDYAGNACHSGLVIANGYQGAAFSTLSAGSGTGTASFDTITRTGVGLYEVAIIANPNAGGSDYVDYWYGHLIIGRGYNGSAVTDYITWCQESPPPRCLYPSGGGGMTVTACMYYSGAEYSSIPRDGSYTIRFKISGYNSSYTGANTTVFLKYIT